MTEIICAAIGCKYNSESMFCTRKEIRLSEHDISTVREGRQHFWKCSGYEDREISEELKNFFKKAVETESRMC